MSWLRTWAIAALLACSTAAVAAPANTEKPAKAPAALKTQLSVKERAMYASYLAKTFEPEVRAQGGQVLAWAKKLGTAVGLADAMNVQRATRMPTLATALAVLAGQPVSSPSVQAALNDAASGHVTSASLGSPIGDTVYTPLPNGRCRVADSRNIGSPITAGETRGLDVEDISSYASYGGIGSSIGDGSSNCGIPSFATAYAVSVTVLTIGQEGFFKIFENGRSFSTGNTIFYTANTSASNDVVVTSCQSCVLELSVYSNASVHYVVDIVGYFMPPVATALDCVTTAATTNAVGAGGTSNATAPACAAGYTQTATNCQSNSWDMPMVYSFGGTCSAKNNGSTSANLSATRTCCRVPGR